MSISYLDDVSPRLGLGGGPGAPLGRPRSTAGTGESPYDKPS